MTKAPARVDVRRGDLTDAGFVRDAVAGARTVFWVDPTPHTAPDPIGTSLETAAPLVEAARAGDVGRVALLSSIGAEKRHGVGHIDALAGIETELDATGTDVLHLRCAYFFTNLLLDLEGLSRGVLNTAFDPEHPMPWVDPRDVADVVAVRLLNDGWRGRTVQAVHGPEDLTFHQVARILTEALGRTVRLDQVGEDALRDTLRAAGLTAPAVEGIVGMSAGSSGLVPEQPRDLLTTTPTRLGGWAHAELRPLLEARPGTA
ncbi:MULTISPECIES: NmrA family NAD(P)-binding protein [unclassified Streptomyces]|uniref:NmrA family NAD(P)-binding protein n=1 Tax=unclassified Streptomyces TaxID=2593676 RepID=UPI002E2FC544|nr:MULTISPECIES: NAD(P)H-binding protein [unclassified Streptomyces]